VIAGTVAAAAVLAGCGGGSGGGGDTDNSAQKFSGTDREQAQVVEDFSDAAGREDWGAICDLFTQDKVELEKGLLSDSCEEAAQDDFEDNHDMNLTVNHVTAVSGDHLVQSSDDEGNNQTFTVVKKIGGGWLIDGYGGTFGADQ
jgi:hypothetical protein